MDCKFLNMIFQQNNHYKGYRDISPYLVPKLLPNLSGGLISIKYKLNLVENYLNLLNYLKIIFFHLGSIRYNCV
jgi:hypothetical protein